MTTHQTKMDSTLAIFDSPFSQEVVLSEEILQGRAFRPVSFTTKLGTVPLSVSEKAFRGLGRAFRTLPIKCVVSASGALSWMGSATVYYPFQAVSLLFSNNYAGKALDVGMQGAHSLALARIQAEERTRTAVMSGVNAMGGPLSLVATVPAIAADSMAKEAERASWSLFVGAVNGVWGIARRMVGCTPIQWTEKKLRSLKDRSYRCCVHPSGLGLELSRYGDELKSRAWIRLHPLYFARNSISPCTEEVFSEFLEMTFGQREHLLDCVLSNKKWIVSKQEGEEFYQTFQRWRVRKELSSRDSAVLKTLYAIYKHIFATEPVLELATDLEITKFLSLSIPEQNERMFYVASLFRNREKICAYENSLQDLRSSDLYDREMVCELVSFSRTMPENYIKEVFSPELFFYCTEAEKLWNIQIVLRFSFLHSDERKKLLQLQANIQDWNTQNVGWQSRIARIVCSHICQISHTLHEKILEVNSDELMMFSKEVRVEILKKYRESLPPISLFSKLASTVQDMFEDEVNYESLIIKGFKANSLSELFYHDKELLSSVLYFLHKTLSKEARVYLRHFVTDCMAPLHMTRVQLVNFIQTTTPSNIQCQVAQEVLRSRKNAQLCPSGKRRFEKLGFFEGRPMQKAGIPRMPGQKIVNKIGFHIVSEGLFYRGSDISGLIAQRSISNTMWTLSLLPQVTGLIADTSIGRGSIYGTMRSLATVMQCLSALQFFNDMMITYVESASQRVGFSWIKEVEERAARLPQLPLEIAVPLQDSLIGHAKDVVGRITSFSERVQELHAIQQKAFLKDETKRQIDFLHEQKDGAVGQMYQGIQRLAQGGGDNDLEFRAVQEVADITKEKLDEIFSQSHEITDAVLELRRAAVPTSIQQAIAETNEQGFLEMLFGSVQNTGNAFLQTILGRSSKTFSEHIRGVDGFDGLATDVSEMAHKIMILQRDYEVAISAQNQLQEAGQFMATVSSSLGDRFASTYTDWMKPALDGAMDLWETEANLSRSIVNSIGTIETVQNQVSFGALRLAMGAGDALGSAAQSVADGSNWFAETIAKNIAYQHEEDAKSVQAAQARNLIDTALSWLATGFRGTAVLASTVGATAARIAPVSALGAFGISPVVVLPFLFKKAFPDMLNSSAESVSLNFGKSLLATSEGMKWMGKYFGKETHKGFEKFGKWVQSSVNMYMGWVDNRRVENSKKLQSHEQRHIVALLKKSKNIPEDVRAELEALEARFFSNSLKAQEKERYIVAILLSVARLQTYELLKMSSSYFLGLTPIQQERIRQAVKRAHPNMVYASDEELVTVFNRLTTQEREKVDYLTQEEYVQLSPQEQRELCFHIIHSQAFDTLCMQNKGKVLSPKEKSAYVDPLSPSLPGDEIEVLCRCYSLVARNEFLDLVPDSLKKFGRARLIRMYEVIKKYHSDWIGDLKTSLETELEQIESMIFTSAEGKKTELFRERILTALASMYRHPEMLEKQREEFFDLSSTEIQKMSSEERKIYINALLEKKCIPEESIVSLMSGVEEGDESAIDSLIDSFNGLSKEEKIYVRQHADLFSHQLKALVKACHKELCSVDKKLEAVSKLHRESQTKEQTHEEFASNLFETNKKSYNTLKTKAREFHNQNEECMKNMRSLLEKRKGLAEILEKQGEKVPETAIQLEQSASSLTSALSEMMINGLVNTLCGTKTIKELQETHEEAKESIRKARESSSEEYAASLEAGCEKLEKAFQSKEREFSKKQEKLPVQLETVLKTYGKEFASAKNRSQIDLTLSEALGKLERRSKNLLNDEGAQYIQEAGFRIRSLYEKRSGILKNMGKWRKAIRCAHAVNKFSLKEGVRHSKNFV